jgi:outer membrane protein TolC
MALESLTQSERNLVYSIRSFSRYQEKFLVDRTSDYLNLLLTQMQLRVEYQLLQNRMRFREEQELRLQGELISQFELDQALRQEYETKNNYISRVESYLSSLDAFKKQLNLPLGKELVLDNSELPELEEIGVSQVPLSDEYGFQLALTNRLDILNEVDKFQDKKRKVKVAKNDLLPSLGLVADYSLKDQYYNQNSFDFGDYSAKAGLSLDLALDKLSERNAYRKSRIDFERQLRSLMETMDGLLDELRKNVRSLERNRQSYIINKKKLEASQRELEKARLDLLVGDRVRPRDILEAQSGVARARNTYYSSLINFHIQRLKLLNNAGVLNTAPQNWWRETQQIPGIQPLEPGDGADEDLPVVPPDEILGTNE